MAEFENNKWAVLIGVDYYMDGDARPDMRFPSLSGCVDDVHRVENYLVESCNVECSRIHKLTATAPDFHQNTPKEAPSEWPTYDNITSVLRNVTELATPNDLVYIHYSGHGARVSTIFNDIKHDNLPDEALVPTDIACEGGRYLRDVEFAYLVQEMVSKNLTVTVVFDCCHSGSANRGQKRNGVRGIDKIDKNVLDTDISIFDREHLAGALNSSGRADGSRTVRVPNYWLLETREYTFLAACRPQEFAYEDYFDDEAHGLLTHYLIDALRTHQQPLSYHQLFTIVSIEVQRHNDQQTVMLAGEGDRLFYSTHRVTLLQGITVLNVLDDTQSQNTTLQEGIRVQLNAGRAQGLSEETELGVWPILCSNFHESEQMARVRVQTVDDVTSLAVLVEVFRTEYAVVRGCQALPLSSVSIRRDVRLLYPDSSEQESQSMHVAALDELMTLWSRRGTKFLLLDRNIDQPFLQVRAEGGMYMVLDSEGQPIPNIVPLSIDQPQELLSRLIHVSKYSNALDLASAGDMSRLLVSITNKPQDSREDAYHVFDPAHSREETSNVKATSNDSFLLSVTNGTDEPLNISILDLDSSWSIEQIHPQKNDYDVLDARKTLFLPLVFDMPSGNTPRVLDTIKVFATIQATGFRWLQLPELGKHGAEGPMPNRGNALSDLQAAMIEDGPGTRKVKAFPVKSVGWMVKQVTVES